MPTDEANGSDDPDGKYKLIITSNGVRVSQACDRCRVKKIKCDGMIPCHNCSKIGFVCKTSDKLTRRAFPKGYTESLERKVADLEEELENLKSANKEQAMNAPPMQPPVKLEQAGNIHMRLNPTENEEFPSNNGRVPKDTSHQKSQTIQINNPIDQIFNLNAEGMIIGNDNLNFESQFNHLLINLNLPFLKITNSHNFLVNEPDSYLYNQSYTSFNQLNNKDLLLKYNALTAIRDQDKLDPAQLPINIYDLFIKLVNNFKKLFNSKRELDNLVMQFFLNYNTFIPMFDYRNFTESYDAFHTMYPFMFTYDDATINGFNLLNNDYHVVNEFLMTVIQIYAMIMISDPTININLLLSHTNPNYSFSRKPDQKLNPGSIVRTLYDFLPYFNVFHISISQLQTYQLFLLYSLLTNNKEKSLILSASINAYIGILGINLNSKNLFFNDLSLTHNQKRIRVRLFWSFKVLLKCFNLKFGFKPSLNTTIINPVTIDRYFQLTPEKLTSLLSNSTGKDTYFETLLKPSVEFLNLMNIIIPSSFSPNYYQYLKGKGNQSKVGGSRKSHPKDLDWILNDDDGDGNDGNLNYNFTQFLIIDENLEAWRDSLKSKSIDLSSLLDLLDGTHYSALGTTSLYCELSDLKSLAEFVQDIGVQHLRTETPMAKSAVQLIKIQLNFHYLLIRAMNYLNFIIDRELSLNFYLKVAKISQEVLIFFLLLFDHISLAPEVLDSGNDSNSAIDRLGLDVDEDGFVINDFSVKRSRNYNSCNSIINQKSRKIPTSQFNFMMNGLSLTIINLKKSIVLQMIYLLICQLKFYKKNEILVIKDSFQVLNKSISIFVKVFINYDTDTVKKTSRKYNEDELFRKLINDELKEEILRDLDSDNEGEEELNNFNGIDWDDEEMDEDLKYLKILKFVKYKSYLIHNHASMHGAKSNSEPNRQPTPTNINTGMTQTNQDVMENSQQLLYPMGNADAEIQNVEQIPKFTYAPDFRKFHSSSFELPDSLKRQKN